MDSVIQYGVMSTHEDEYFFSLASFLREVINNEGIVAVHVDF